LILTFGRMGALLNALVPELGGLDGEF